MKDFIDGHTATKLDDNLAAVSPILPLTHGLDGPNANAQLHSHQRTAHKTP